MLRLFAKEALIAFLLRRDEAAPETAASLAHVRGLRDVVELRLTPGGAAGVWACPVTGLEMTGLHRFLAMVPCGCVVSERAFREVPADTCHKCAGPVAGTLVLNGTQVGGGAALICAGGGVTPCVGGAR